MSDTTYDVVYWVDFHFLDDYSDVDRLILCLMLPRHLKTADADGVMRLKSDVTIEVIESELRRRYGVHESFELWSSDSPNRIASDLGLEYCVDLKSIQKVFIDLDRQIKENAKLILKGLEKQL